MNDDLQSKAIVEGFINIPIHTYIEKDGGKTLEDSFSCDLPKKKDKKSKNNEQIESYILKLREQLV